MGACFCQTCCCCVNASQTCTSRQGQPVSTSGPAIDAASCITNGTRDNIDALITSGLSVLGSVLGAQQQQKIAAVKAQTQVAQTQSNMVMWVAIAIVAVIGFIVFAKVKVVK